MPSFDKTIKMRAYTAEATKDIAPSDVTEDQKISQELASKTAQLEEEKNNSLENLKVIGQLRESIKQEQAKSSELTRRVSELGAEQKNVLDSSKKATEYEAKIAGLQSMIVEQQTKLNEQKSRIIALEEKILVQETKARTLQDALNKISSLATTAK